MGDQVLEEEVRRSGARWWVLLALALPIGFLDGPAFAQKADFDRGRELHSQSIAAYREGDYERFRSLTVEALEVRPGHPSLIYNMAAAHALTGDSEGALRRLEQYADLGLSAAVGSDSDFESISAMPEFTAIAARIEENSRPLVRSKFAFSISDSAFFPEGIAYDRQSKSFFVSSIVHRKIARFRDGTVGDFVVFDGERSPLGMAVDPTRRRLWVNMSVVSEISSSDERPALVGLDLDTGRIVTEAEGGTFLGDVALGPHGEVYASDPLAGMIYALAGDSLAPLIPAGQLVSPQGIAVAPNALFVADYAQGIYRIDLTSKRPVKLRTPPDAMLLGIDGLILRDGRLIGIQNGAQPRRVLLLDFEDDSITNVSVLEKSHPDFDEPTTGVLVDGDLYYVANGQWGRLSRESGRSTEPVILKLTFE